MSNYMSTDMINYSLLGNNHQNEISREHFNNIPSDIIDNIVIDLKHKFHLFDLLLHFYL